MKWWCRQRRTRSKLRQYGAHFFGDFRREGVDLIGPSVIARCARAGHDAQTLDHEPTAHVLALRAEDGKRPTGVWQEAALSVFTSRGGDVSQGQVTLSVIVGSNVNGIPSGSAIEVASNDIEVQMGAVGNFRSCPSSKPALVGPVALVAQTRYPAAECAY